MDLINRYLQAVKFWLPAKQKQDIIAELSEDIHSQIEERESALGRKLTDDDVEQVLRQRGRPLLVAEKYLPQKSLIGPVLFPAYQFVLKLALLCYLVPWVGVWIALEVINPSYRANHLGIAAIRDAYTLWFNAITAFAVVTIVFAVLERVKDQSWLFSKWSPRQLPPVRDVHNISRFGSAVELVFGIFFGVWWLKILWMATLFDTAGVRIGLSSVWRDFFWAFVFLALVNTGLSATNLLRPYWTRPRRGIRAAVNFITGTVLVLLSKAHATVTISGPDISADKAAQIARIVALSLELSLAIGAIACFAIGAVDLWRAIARDGNRVPLTPGVVV